MDVKELVAKAWEIYGKALELLETGDIRDAAEKSWLAVETMIKAIMVSANIPYEKAKKVNLSLNVFSKILEILDREELLSEYYALNATLHGMAFYEGVLNEDTTRRFIKRAEEWLRKAEALLKIVAKIDASQLMTLEEEKMKIKARIISENMRILDIKAKEDEIIRTLKKKLVS